MIDSEFQGVLRKNFSPDEFEMIRAFLGRGFSIDATRIIAGTFNLAKDKGRGVEEVLAVCETEWTANWGAQPWQFRGDTEFAGWGSQNAQSFQTIRKALGLE